jgi:hypothetical protein
MDAVLRKKMIVCTPFGKFVNGDQKGVMDVKRLRGLVENFNKHPRPVPIYAMGDHVGLLDERVPDGWVEGLTVDADGRLVAAVKLEGEAARLVLGDKIRLASIATVQGKNPDGTAQGEVLQHVLLTNDAFDKNANIQIAAALAKGAELYATFTTALHSEKEVGMADQNLHDEIARLKDENAALKAMTADEKVAAELKESQALLSEKIRETVELTAANENLKADVERLRSNPEMEVAFKQQERQLRASKIRRLVQDGVGEGQFNRAMVGDPKSTYNHTSDEAVLAWFKTSLFKDSFEKLEFALSTFPKLSLRKQFGTGESDETRTATMTDQDKESVVALGHTPEKVKAGYEAKNINAYRAAVSEKR